MAEDQGARRTGTVTLLFTDLVSSTELLDRLGDEDFERLRRIHFQLLREAVAASGGEEVKNLGDGLMVVFPSALDAIGCAVAMQQAVALHNAEPDVAPISVRVGLHAGEPIVEEDDYFGTPVVVAKRLCDQAQGGQILVSDLVAALVGGRRQFSFRETGAMELKGLGEPLPTREVVWGDEGETSRAVPPPPPPAPSAVPPPLPPLPPEVHRSAEAAPTGPRWKRWGIGALAVIGALSVLGAIVGQDEPSDEGSAATTTEAPPATTDGGTSGMPSIDVSSPDVLGEARPFAVGRDPDEDEFLLVGQATPGVDGGDTLPLALREGEVVTILAQTERARVEPFLELLDPDGGLATFDIDQGGDGKPAIFRWLVPRSGRYAVRVSTLTRVRGAINVIARSEPVENPADEPDAFAAAVELGDERPEAAWSWDTGESGELFVRLVPHPEAPMQPTLHLENAAGEEMDMTAVDLRQGTAHLELPEGGEWELVLGPGGDGAEGMVNLQVWIVGKDRPEPEKLR